MKHTTKPKKGKRPSLLPAKAEQALASLNATEKSDLSRCESVIEAGLTTFIDVGLALEEIRNKRLYRNDYHTFHDYCEARWNFGRFYALRQIAAARLGKDLLTIVNIPHPTHEAQLRPLIALPQEDAIEVWRKTAEKSKGGGITAKKIKETASELFPKPMRRRKRESKSQLAEVVTLADQIQTFLRKGKNEAAREALANFNAMVKELLEERD